jgi:tetratricopeptide (TPR) repeat protein
MNEETIFHEALARPLPAERAAYLEQACADNPALRASVEALLRANEGASQFLASPASAPLVATVDEPITEGPSTLVGPYKLLEQIGEGGFGVVFMAEQQQPIRRKVALKVLKPGMDTRQVITRFEAERQALALMDHPNIARVLDAGQTSNGRPYFVMELVKGLAITEYCDQRRLTPRERLELFVQVCQAVQHAHRKGIIHRDLKPSNVLVTVQDGRPLVKAIDFGIAKALGEQLTDKTLFTGFAQLIGTPLYMAPEQAALSNVDVDTRSDVYSLGVLLYELLTGTTPFTKDRFKEADYDEMRRIIREEEPPRPSTRISTLGQAATTLATQRRSEPKRLSQLLRGDLDWIVMKALEKDRNRRYESASAFGADVQRYLLDEPVLACPPSAWYRLRKFARRNKGKLAVAAGMLLVVTVMAASIGWAVRDRAAHDEEIEREDLARRTTVAARVRDSLTMVRALIGENKLAAARQKLAEAGARLSHDRSALGELTAEVDAGTAELDRFGQFLDWFDRASQASTTPTFEAALGGAGRRDTVLTVPSASALDGRASTAAVFLLRTLHCYDILERDDWRATLEGGLLGRDQIEEIRRTAYEALLWLANDVGRRQKDHRSGEQLSQKAATQQGLVYLGKAESAHRPTQAFYLLRADFRKALGEDAGALADRQMADRTAPTIGQDHFLRGWNAFEAKQLPEAVRAFEAALRLEPKSYWSMVWLGYCLCDLGRGPEDFAGAARVFTGCILKRPDHAHAYVSRATACIKLGRYEDALADCSRAIELNAAHAYAWNQRATAYFHLGRPHKAVADFSTAIELNPKLVIAWNNRGATYCFRLAQYDKAVADFSRAIELDPQLANPRGGRGLAYLNLGQPNKAVADFAKAIELDAQWAAGWNNRGKAYVQLGQWAKALADFSRAIELDATNAHAWSNRGAIYCGHFAQPHKALADCSRAIELEPKLASAWGNRGAAYVRLGQLDRAIADFSEALRLDPKLAMAWGNRGATYLQLDQPVKAVPDLSKFIEIAPGKDPRVALAFLLRARAHCRLANYAQARTDFESVLQGGPANASVLNELAWLLTNCPEPKLRDPCQAVELARRAVAKAPKAGNYWTTLGAALYRTGDSKAAVAALDRSVLLRQGGEAVDQLCLAMAHKQLGNREEARKAYDRAVQWLEKNKEGLEKNKPAAEDVRRLRDEAEEVLELKKK